MSAADDNNSVPEDVSEPISAPVGVPEAVDPQQGTGEVSMMPPEEASKVMAEIKAVAESRGDDSQVHEMLDIPPTGPIPVAVQGRDSSAHLEDQLGVDELRDAWPLLDLEERGDGLRVLPREDAEEFFISLAPRDQADLLLHFRAGQRRQWMRLLEPDDVADVIQQAGEANRTTLLALLDDPTRKEVLALLAYAEDEAGGLMSTRYARLRPEMSADEALSYLRRQARAKVETIYVAYVLDAAQRLLGVVSFRDLFGADPKVTVAEIMETDIVRVTDEMDQETVSRIFAEHDLNVIPVVDKDGKMKGIVTVDDIVDVVQEEATEDAQKFGGMEALDMPYLASSRGEMIKKRARWLTILLIGEMFTATALGFFQHELDKAIVLSLFLPLIISSGGNSGSQASTLVIRAMALGEVRVADWLRVFRREVQMGIVLGAILGSVAAVRVMVWGEAGAYEGSAGEHFVLVGLTVAASLVGCVLWGTLMGAMLPFLLRKIKADPASASAPLVATLVDVSGIIIYFTIASLILTGTVIRSVADTCSIASRDEITATFSDPTLVQRLDSPHQRGNTSRCQWIGVTGTLTVHAEISDKGGFDDARDDAPSAIDLPGIAEAAYYDPALRQLTAYQHDELVTVGFAGTPTPAQIAAGAKTFVAKIAPRL
ncbi:MAG TPA: magnesium transporter [Kofleriaceae bacterium]|jgi:magnesium transporter|nr:magnesium transporter [Kofleriaceae bacterium]